MAISDRIQSIATHIEDTYDTFSLSNTTIDFNKNIQNIPKGIRKSYLDIMNNGIEVVWNNWEKVIGEGTSLTLNNTLEAKMKIDLKGNTSQETTTGKNRFNINGTYTTNSATLTINNNTLTQTNTGTYCRSVWEISNLVVGNNYTFSCSFANPSRCSLRINIMDSTNTNIIEQSSTKTTADGDFNLTFEATETTHYIRIYTNTSSTSNSYTATFSEIQLESGSAATSYEPYTGEQPAPSPSYPFPINVVSGNNSIKVEGKNIWNLNSSYSNTGSSSAWVLTDTSVSIPAGTYTFSCNNTGSTNSVRFNWKYADNTESYSRFTTSTTVTFTSEVKKVAIQLNANTTISNIQIEQNNQATTYTPYVSQTYPINLPVKNLFDKNNANILQMNLADISTTSGLSPSNRVLYIPIKPNTTYTVSKAISTYFVIGTTESTPTFNLAYSQRQNDATAKSLTITTSSTAKYLVLWYYNSGADTLTEQQILDSIQIEYGSKANRYTPYGTTPIELCKIGDYQDRIYKDNGVWYLHKEIGKVVLDGSEGWNYAAYGTNSWDLNNVIDTTFDTNKLLVLSSVFKGVAHKDRSTSGNNIIYAIADKMIEIRNTTLTTQAQVQSETNGTPLYYVLATPTYTQITDNTLIGQLNALEGANSYDNQTNVSQVNNDLASVLNATALEQM